MPFAENQDMIQTVAPRCPDQALNISDPARPSRLTRAERAARAAGMLDYYLLAKELTQMLSDNASRYIAWATGSKRNNNGQRSGCHF